MTGFEKAEAEVARLRNLLDRLRVWPTDESQRWRDACHPLFVEIWRRLPDALDELAAEATTEAQLLRIRVKQPRREATQPGGGI